MSSKFKGRKKTRSRGLARWLYRSAVRIMISVLFIIGLGLGVTALQVWWLKGHNPQRTAWMKMRIAQMKDKKQTVDIKQTWVALKSLPRYVPAAVIAAEDDGFYAHRGFDWDAIRQAAAHNERKGRVRRGGSTITQQLAKNLYLSPERTYIRKAREAVVTIFLERILSKQRILELYLNVIEFGPGVFGIEESAKHHFKVHAARLTVDQACRLAAIIPAPLKSKVTGNYIIRRAERINRCLDYTQSSK